jgi:hypothetical protein
MDENEKPLSTRFWTWDMVALAAVNIIFIILIIAGLWVVAGAVHAPVTAWLKGLFGV